MKPNNEEAPSAIDVPPLEYWEDTDWKEYRRFIKNERKYYIREILSELATLVGYTMIVVAIVMLL